jgi:hypothetical protein
VEHGERRVDLAKSAVYCCDVAARDVLLGGQRMVRVVFQLPSRRLLVKYGHERRHRGRKGARAGLRLHAHSVQSDPSSTAVVTALASVSGITWPHVRSPVGRGRHELDARQVEFDLLGRGRVDEGGEVVVGECPLPGGTVSFLEQRGGCHPVASTYHGGGSGRR